MKRVLVPLDGSKAAESVIPEAIRLAGHQGELILMHDVARIEDESSPDDSPDYRAEQESERYLAQLAAKVRQVGARVRTETFVWENPASAIDEAARMFEVDFIACHTQARSGLRRVLRPSIAWEVLAHSPVPVLLQRDREVATPTASFEADARLLVTLDGSPLAELALPVAESLSAAWNAEILLVRVVLSMKKPEEWDEVQTRYLTEEMRAAETYLTEITGRLERPAQALVIPGPVVEVLGQIAVGRGITHVVMASHGRTGLARATLGSIADEVIHRISLPVIIIPAWRRAKVTAEAKAADVREPEMVFA